MKTKLIWIVSFILVLSIGIFFRFYHFQKQINFSAEQAITLSASAQIATTGKLSLIGEPYFIRQTTAGHSFFNAGTYLYPLALIQKFFGFDPTYVTAYYAILNIFTGILIYWISAKILDRKAALIAMSLFMVNPTMIYYSHFVWHINLLILLTALTILATQSLMKHCTPSGFLLLGIIAGLGFGVHLSFIVIVFVTLLLLIYKLSFKKVALLSIFFFLGFLIGDLPLVLFDLRHNFYNLKTMFEFLGNGNTSGIGIQPYYLVSWYVPIFIAAGWLLRKLKSVWYLGSVLVILASSLLLTNIFNANTPGMPAGWNIEGINKVSHIISQDKTDGLQIASIIDGETRATPLRYYLKYLFPTNIKEETDYHTKVLYVISHFDPKDYQVWEIDSVKPAQVVQAWPIQNGINLYKLEHED